MKLILLSGGSGKRLWPLSNDSRSKQFLRLLKDPQGRPESMVQRVWRQLRSLGLAEHAYIATGKAQTEMLRSQLGAGVPIIEEPSRRDTFPAISLATTYLHSVLNVPQDEIVAILPVDPYVEERFFEAVSRLDEILSASGADLALIGVRPTYPSEKYGYILPEFPEREPGFYAVSRFTEKPNAAEAQRLIERQALWNCGVFAFRLGYLIDLLEARGIATDYHLLKADYSALPKISFDYAVVEKAEHIAVLPYDGYWKDLGTWNTLTDEMADRQLGRGIISDDSEGAHLINELDLPVALLGVPDVVVAVSPDGILVTSKDASPRVKELVTPFDGRLMYEERWWGWYRVLDYVRYPEGRESLTRRVCLKAGCNLSYHVHRKRTETWTVTNGNGLVVRDGKLFPIQAGDVIRIPPGSLHSVKALVELEMIEVQSGEEVLEEDIDRLCLAWDDIPLEFSGGRKDLSG